MSKDICFDPNPLFYKMLKYFKDNKDNLFDVVGYDEPIKKCVRIFNEGGSRSSKTFDFFHLLYYICSHNQGRDLKIYVLRNQLKKCREVTLEDFKKVLQIIGDYDPKNLTGVNTTPKYNLFGNSIEFRGLDDEKNSEGYPSDIVFINEVLDIPSKSLVEGIIMRCRMLLVGDWNPKFTEHWAFDFKGQDNTLYTHTTHLNNKKLDGSVRATLLSYSPYIEDDIVFNEGNLLYKGKVIGEDNKPPAHPINTISINGAKPTADERRWRIYTRGVRGSVSGLIFKDVVYIDNEPDFGYSYGIDFGFTNDPTAIVKVWEDKHNIYTKLLFYAPVDSPSKLNDILLYLRVEKHLPIIADSSDRYTKEGGGTIRMVKDLRGYGWRISKINKIKSVVYWIESMNSKNIHIVKDDKNMWLHAKKEQENYLWQENGGALINNPIDKNNHFWDATRYKHMANNIIKNISFTIR